MKKLSLLFLAALPFVSATKSFSREVNIIDNGWLFTLTSDSLSGRDSLTETVDLPHDWSIEYPFDRHAASGNDGGYVRTGQGKYVKDLEFSRKDLEGRRHSLLFEGVYERWSLIVNGDTVGFRPYGYSTVEYDITPYLRPGRNRIEVTVDNSHQKNSRWFTGSGIYRHVRHITTGMTSVNVRSLFITTPQVATQEATVKVSFDIERTQDAARPLDAEIKVFSPAGVEVSRKKVEIKGEQVATELKVDNPALWSPETPNLYKLEITLSQSGKDIDNLEQNFGIRLITCSASDGLLLNGKPIMLNGACVHHDNGLLGAASFDAAEARKVRLLKEAGFNAVRTSHNPASPAFLDECDRQGLLVINEAFDGWRDSKTPNDYHLWIDEWGNRDMEDLILRDRNHPSVMAWSIGNEVIERKKIEVVSTARRLAEVCRRLDPTRPVTEALCAWDSDWEIYDPHAEVLDIVGYNYMIHKSESDHARCPERIMWQTESYPADAAANWHKVKENPYIIGDFVWTGLDYLGESGIGRFFYNGATEGEHYERDQWPWHGAYCGDIDITGWRKPVSHYRDMLYNDRPGSRLYMAVREPDGYYGTIKTTKWSVWPQWESWTWPGHEGRPIDVEVMSRYPKVRLFLNDELIGEAPAGEDYDCIARFTLPYAPGNLRAVAVDEGGKAVETTELVTAGEPTAIRLTADKASLVSDGQDLVYIVVEVLDADGRIVPDAALPLHFSLSGPGVLKAAGNADLTDNSGYTGTEVNTWKGRALAILKSSPKKGNIHFSVSSPGLNSSPITIPVR